MPDAHPRLVLIVSVMLMRLISPQSTQQPLLLLITTQIQLAADTLGLLCSSRHPAQGFEMHHRLMSFAWQVDAHLKAPLPRPRETAPPSPRSAVYGVAHYRRERGSAGQGVAQEAAEPRARACALNMRHSTSKHA